MEITTTQLIIDTSSGTIVSLNDCRIVSGDLLPLHHDLSDGEVSELAERHGETITPLGQYTEEQALDLMWEFSRRFGWKGALFTRADVRQVIIDQCGERPTIDLQVEQVMDTRMWRKYLEEAIAREGMECIYEAIVDVENGVAL